MLKKGERLKEKYLFNAAFKKRQKLSTPLIHLYYLFNKKDINRLQGKSFLSKNAFIVSTSIDKRANVRNLIKRRMKASYNQIKNMLLSQDKSYVLIWIANPLVKNATFEQIKTAMKTILSRLVKI